ncbi:unnamed protein product [Pleuronectes platessa]|uniref:Uncharacterized protein n=1 Tax=Pleuronectes platessa TaxID=8262 RepID=A0A9N7YC58_PLEPL|nr:unnamed protein product [Pleuronectes platessa]
MVQQHLLTAVATALVTTRIQRHHVTQTKLLGASRRVPPAVAVAEVIREKGPTRVQSDRRRPPYPVPSNGPPSAPAMDTAPRYKRKKAPRTSDAVRCHRMRTSRCRTLSLRRRGEEGDGGTAPPAAARAQRFYHKYEHRPMISVKVKFITDKPISVNEANIGRYRCSADKSDLVMKVLHYRDSIHCNKSQSNTATAAADPGQLRHSALLLSHHR